MMGSEILDVLIGLVVVFFLMSIMASAVREAVEGYWKSRAVFLERGIRELLNDRDGTGISREFYRHPLIYSLFHGTYSSEPKSWWGSKLLARTLSLLGGRSAPKRTRWRGSGLPTYIPARNFAVAVMDMVVRPEATTPYAVHRTESSFTIEELRAGVARLEQSPFLQRAMLSAIDSAHDNVERVQENLQAWFDSGMDRVSGWYKRRTHLHLFIIGLALTASLNVDTLRLANHLWRNKAAREALVKRADLILADSSYIKAVREPGVTESERALRVDSIRARYNDLAALDLPITWEKAAPPPDAGLLWWARSIIGFLLTAAAITLGAPFWFDLLNKMMVIRSTVKPQEKSPEEGSEDRKGKSQRTPIVLQPPPPAPAPTGAAAQTASPTADAKKEPAAAFKFAEHTWVDGKEEGLL